MCMIQECSNKIFARKYCSAHYKRWRKYGDPVGGKWPVGATPEERFMTYVPSDAGAYECWIWLGSISKGSRGGYGIFWGGKKHVRAHNWLWEKVNGKRPDGFVLDHLCRTRSCLNLSHLELVTSRENTLRGNSACAINARKTHCIRGHAFTPDNTQIYRTARICRICSRATKRRYKERIKNRGIS